MKDRIMEALEREVVHLRSRLVEAGFTYMNSGSASDAARRDELARLIVELDEKIGRDIS